VACGKCGRLAHFDTYLRTLGKSIGLDRWNPYECYI
jgi:hypothetical protein